MATLEDLNKLKSTLKDQNRISTINQDRTSQLAELKSSVKTVVDKTTPDLSQQLESMKSGLKGYTKAVGDTANGYTDAVGKTMDKITTPTLDIKTTPEEYAETFKLGDVSQGFKQTFNIFAPSHIQTEPITTAKGGSSITPTAWNYLGLTEEGKAFRSANINNEQALIAKANELREKALQEEQTGEKTLATKTGEALGEMYKFGQGYALGGSTVESAVAPVAERVGMQLGAKIAPIAGQAVAKFATSALPELATEFSKDVIIGQPINYIEGKERGLEGKELAEYIGEQAILDIVANGVFYGLGKGVSALKKMNKSQLEDVITKTASETTLDKETVSETVDKVLKEDIQPTAEPTIKPETTIEPTTTRDITIPKQPRLEKIEGIETKAQTKQQQLQELKQSIIGKPEIVEPKLDDLKAQRFELIEQLDAAKKEVLPDASPKRGELNAKRTELEEQLEMAKGIELPKGVDEATSKRNALTKQRFLDDVRKQISVVDEQIKAEGSRIKEANKIAKQQNIDTLTKQIDELDQRIKTTGALDVQKQKTQIAKETERMKKTKALETMKAEQQVKRTAEQYRKAESKIRTQALKDLQKLKGKRLRPEYQEMADEILNLVDTKAKGISPKKEVSLKKTKAYFDKILEQDPEFVLNPKVKADIERLEKFKINDLTLDELADIQDTVAHIRHLNDTKNALINNQKVRTIKEVTDGIQTDNASKVIGNRLKKEGPVKKFIDMYYGSGAIDPSKLFKRLGNYSEDTPVYKLYQQLEEGVRNKLGFEQNARKYIEGIGGIDKNFSDVSQTFKAGGRDITLTPKQKISVYLHSKNPDNLRHMIEGGIRTPDMASTVKVTQDEINAIVSALTPQEKAFADNLGYYFDNISKNALNKTSMDLDGFEIARVNNYYPIVTDKFYRSKNFQKFANAPSIEGMGILKERTKAKSPIMIEDVMDVIDRNINQVSQYSGMAVPLRNTKAVFGNADVQRTLRNAYGDSINETIAELIKNLDGGYAMDDITNKVLNKIVSNSSKAVLGANPKVWLNQLASLPTATAELDAKYLIQGFKEKLPTNELMEKYSPEIWKRNKGFVTRETGELVKGGASEIFTMPIQKFDNMAIRKIWNGVEKEILDTTNLIKGSDEFYEAVARRTEDVIHKTQPNYETLYRSRAGTQKGALPRLMTLFGTQRNKNYSMLYDAIATAKNTGDTTQLKKVMPALLASSLVIAGINTGQRELRGQEGEFGEDFINSFISNPYLIGNIFNSFVNRYDMDNIAEDSINDLINSVNQIFRHGNKTTAGKLKDLTEATAKLAGIPATNLRKYFEDALRATNDEMYYEYQQIWEEPTRSDLYSSFSEALKEKNSSYLSRVAKDLREAGATQSTLKSSMKRKGIPESQYRPFLRYLPTE